MRLFSSLFFASAFLVSALPAQAAPQNNPGAQSFPPDQRFAVLDEDSGSVSMNVEIKPVEKVPPFIQQQIDMIKQKCLAGGAEIRAFQYVSDYNRSGRLPPSYLLDMTGLKPSQTKACSYGTICFDSGNCSLIGFAPIDHKTWDRTAWVTARSWAPFVFNAPDKKGTITYFSLKAAMDDCENRGGVKDDGLCNLHYVWKSGGVSLIPFELEQK